MNAEELFGQTISRPGRDDAVDQLEDGLLCFNPEQVVDLVYPIIALALLEQVLALFAAHGFSYSIEAVILRQLIAHYAADTNPPTEEPE